MYFVPIILIKHQLSRYVYLRLMGDLPVSKVDLSSICFFDGFC